MSDVLNLKSAYLYRHIRLDTNEVFYVGIGYGTTFKRSRQRSTRNRHWKFIVTQTEYRIDILLTNMTWEQACEKEKEFILLYGRRDLGKGTLVNMTDGGEGAYGRVVSEKTKIKISESLAKGTHYMTGKTHSDEAKRKISAASLAQTRSADLGKKISAATKGKKKTVTNKTLAFLQKRREGLGGKRVIDSVTGEIFPSVKIAAAKLGIGSKNLGRYLQGHRKNKTTLKYLDK